jgi:SAM-dependent methyltransferase
MITMKNDAPTAPLYTKFPYPGDGIVRTTVAKILQGSLGGVAPEGPWRRGFHLIDLGCGTGEVLVGVAKAFPAARIVAIDINPASLRLAEDLARRHRVEIEFVQADLARGVRRALSGRGLLPPDGFDLVTSMGVLHHLAAPSDGFRTAREVVSPHGLFLCYMYSRFGRWSDPAVQRLLNDAAGSDAGYTERSSLVKAMRLSDSRTLPALLRLLGDQRRYGPPMSWKEMFRVHFRRSTVEEDSDRFSNPCEHLLTFRELEDVAACTGWHVLGLAPRGGLPTTVEEFSRDPARQTALRRLDRAVLYDYFAYQFRASGFAYYLQPSGDGRR